MEYKTTEKERERRKAYYQAHREEILKKMQEYGKKHKEEKAAYNKAYWNDNKEELKNYHKDYYEKNREKHLQQKKEYYKAKRSEILAYKNQYWKEQGKYNAKRREYWKIFIENGGKLKCDLCGTKEDLLIHHKDINHFNNDPNNLQCLCRSCHTALHNKLKGAGR